MPIQIKKAVRERVYLKVAVGGPTGSGKTWGAIGIAKGLAPSGKILVLDTENRSASYYAGAADAPGAWDFDVVEIEAPFTPTKYLEGLKAAIDHGYEAVVIDSLTHEWNASGGILDQKSQKDARGGNSFTNWNDMKQVHNKFVETLLQSKIHVVCTLRSKMEYVMEEDANKKTQVKKIGLAPISSDGMEYEFGVFFDVDRNTHLAVATKDRTGLFDGRSIHLGDEIGKELRSWRDSGAELNPEPPSPTTAPTTAPKASASPAASVGTKATQPSAHSAAQPVAQGAQAPTYSPEWIDAMAELAAVTVGMPDKTRAALVASFEAEGPASLEALRAEIATLRGIMHPGAEGYQAAFAEQNAEVLAVKQETPQQVSQEASDFVDGVSPGPEGAINEDQYQALNSLIKAFAINRDALRSYMAKAGHLLPGANGPTLARMKVDEWTKLRDKLTNQKKASGTETWSQRTVRIINATPITTYQPIPAAS